MDPKFIYFDLDDTLLDHRGAEKAALNDLYHQFDFFSITTPDTLIETYHRINTALWREYGKGEIERKTLQRLRFEKTLRSLRLDESACEEVGDYYMKAYRNHWSWTGGAEAVFKHISTQFDVGILTNGFAETQKKKIEQFGLADTARHLVISEETGYLKPQPEIFEHATSLTRHKPEEILYIGDSYTSDVIGGTAFGWNVAWYTEKEDTKNERHRDAHFVFDDFEELKKLLNL
ncbi:YjjG family noncanonical pyrimidine nucleotidase [Halalkalibaculum sp. DA3122]|uniref:YjjG family noncanonical pyrimidine nucleotidase n=1 Tax=unclassified Halalkalibaculum TaxID=2964617 RepID=UPI0037548C2C